MSTEIRKKLELKNGEKLKELDFKFFKIKNNIVDEYNINKHELETNMTTFYTFKDVNNKPIIAKLCVNLYNAALDIFEKNKKITTLDPRDILVNIKTLDIQIICNKKNKDFMSFNFKNRQSIIENTLFLDDEDRKKSLLYSVGAIIFSLFEQFLLWTFSDELTNVTSTRDNYYSIYKKYDCIKLYDSKLIYIFEREFDFNDPKKYFTDYNNEDITEYYLKITNGVIDLSELLGYF